MRLEEAWSSLIANDEAEPLMNDVNHLINDFESKGLYPTLDEVKLLLIKDYFDCCRQTVKWASVYAGLSAVAARNADISVARQLIASAALVLFGIYRPRSEEAYNNYVSRKGGKARSAQWKGMKEELHKLIQHEISSNREPFNSKTEAAEYFAGLLNPKAETLDVKNSQPSMSGTIKNWFTTDDALNKLIKNLISPTPTRKRSKP
jgi:hypothetical protein